MSRPLARLTAALAVLVGTLAIGVMPAAAHVSVQPSSATQGGFSGISFRVPTERDNASTTKVEVTVPAEQPLAFFSVKPHPGWDYEVARSELPEPVEIEGTTVTEAVSSVTWTAQNAGAAIGPGEYDDFSVSVGFLPEDDEMVFKAVQTYDSGEVVRWIEEAAPGADEPEHPAPTLQLTPAPAPGETALAAAGNDDTDGQSAGSSAADGDGSDGLLVGLAATAVLLGGVGAVLGGLAFRRAR